MLGLLTARSAVGRVAGLKSSVGAVRVLCATHHPARNVVRDPAPTFDTHEAVLALRNSGFSTAQAEGVVEVLKSVIHQTVMDSHVLMASKDDLVELRASLSERVFNSTLKFDIAQRHSRELLERDFQTLRSDLKTQERADHIVLLKEISRLEKASLEAKGDEDERFATIHTDIERVEKRMIQYSFGFLTAVATVALGVARLLV